MPKRTWPSPPRTSAKAPAKVPSGWLLLNVSTDPPTVAEITTLAAVAVDEPLNLHGWQLVDELNRLLVKQPVSGYVVPVHLVTPGNGYRAVYRRIWGS